MPDRLKDIHDTLEEIQAGGGLGGGGGGADVSALAKEETLADVLAKLTLIEGNTDVASLVADTAANTTSLDGQLTAANAALADVVTNTAATTVAIGALETNVITASGVQTLSLNSATSAQTTTLGTAIGATNTAVQAVKTSVDALKTSVDADALVQTDILGNGLDILTETTNCLTELQNLVHYLAAPITCTPASVVSSATSVILSNLNPERRSLTIFNNPNSHLFICTSATAAQASAICRIDPYGYYEMPKPVLIDIISGIWESAHGNASIYEGV